jgi:tetratricopeptide (TPR) repeat protein
MRLGQFAAAGDAFKEARAATLGGSVEEARLMQREAFGSLRLGRYPLALRRLTRAIATLDGIDGDEAAAQRARLYGAYGAVLQHQHRPQLAVEWCEKAIAEASDLAAARDALANAYRVIDWAYLTLGRLDDAVHLDLAAEIYEELGELDHLAWVTNNLGGLAFLAGRWNDALTYVQRARDAWRKMGDETSASVAQFNMAQLLSDQGRSDEAEPLLRDALDVRRTAGNPLEVALTASALGRLVARAGGFGEARELLNEARTLFEQEGDEVELLTADSRLLEALVLEGDSAAALELSTALVERSAGLEGVALQVAMLHRLRGWALMQSVALAAAHEELLESLRISQRGDANFGAESADYDAALTLDALVRLGELTGEDTSEYERERDAIFERLGVVATPKPPLSRVEAESS